MSQTKKNISDSLIGILTRFNFTDDSRLEPDYMYYKIDQARAALIVDQYSRTGVVDMTWLTDLNLITCYKVGRADNNSISCGCDISKTTIPSVISLQSKDGNNDLGLFSITSACGRYSITPKLYSRWQNFPPENVSSLFTYYWRINDSVYFSDPNLQKVRIVAILLTPEDGKLISSAPIASGSLVSGTVYLVKNSQVVYNSIVRLPNTTFTANATATFTGTGTVYLNSQANAYADTDPYPASGEMIRQIELEILTKEFGIEKQAIVDIRNDSVDDALKVNA